MIHVPFRFFPDAAGGTEVYVASLAGWQKQQGLSVSIAAPAEKTFAYEHDGMAVRRFAVAPVVRNIRELYGEGEPTAAHEFAKILEQERPDVVHLHAFTRGVSLRAVREAKRRGIKIVFTYHTPTVSCQRGTLLRWGTETCDGRLDVRRCAACTLHGLGILRPASHALSVLPPAFGRMLGMGGLEGGVWTALRMSELLGFRDAAFRSLMQEVDRVVVLCEWSRDLLLRNGVPAGKMTLSRHGLPAEAPAVGRQRAREQAAGDAGFGSNRAPGEIGRHMPPHCATRQRKSCTRIAFLGRLDPTKGPDILLRAIRSEPELDVRLDLYGIVQDGSHENFFEELKGLAAGDPRISFLPQVPSDRVPGVLQGYHALAVPSRWLETGPLVVLEAFAAGIPVIGSDLGGIAELVEHDVNGILVKPGSVEAWSRWIRRCCDDRGLLERLGRGIRPPRTMKAVACEMHKVYQPLLGTQPIDGLRDKAAYSGISGQS